MIEDKWLERAVEYAVWAQAEVKEKNLDKEMAPAICICLALEHAVQEIKQAMPS